MGLYILGSGSSNGKTTFVMQIGDHIANQEKDVLKQVKNGWINKKATNFHWVYSQQIDRSNKKSTKAQQE